MCAASGRTLAITDGTRAKAAGMLALRRETGSLWRLVGRSDSMRLPNGIAGPFAWRVHEGTMAGDSKENGDVFYVEAPLPANVELTAEERERILDNYRWFSKFPPFRKLFIAWRQRAIALYFQELARGRRS